MSQQALDPAVALVLKRYTEARSSHHDRFVAETERLYRAWRGHIELRSEAAAWTSKYHAPYILQMIESMVAAIADPNPKVRIRPRPKLGDDVGQQITAAKTLENLIGYELDIDRYAEKQRAWVLQALICKISVQKVYWREQKGYSSSLVNKLTDIHDANGMLLDTVSSLHEQTSEYTDEGACVEIRDVRDFFWPESAVDVRSAPWVIDRVWVDPKRAREIAADYGVSVDDLPGDTWQPADEGREQTLFGKRRTKNLLPILEMWENDRVVTVLNGKLLLRDSDKPADPNQKPGNPYWHGQKPFVVTSGMPEPFQFAGISIVEIVDHLQEMVWSLQNQRLDGLRLLANPIWLMRADVASVDDFEWAPGAIWAVEDTNQAKPLDINPELAQITMSAEAVIKADMRDIPGGDLFSGGTQGQIAAADTATQAALAGSISQKLVQARQQNFRFGQRDAIELVGQNLQQFMRLPETIEIAGPGAQPTWLPVTPTQIQGRFDYVADVADESTIRQERQAEWSSRLQVLQQVQQTAALFGVVLDWKALITDAMEQGFGIDNAARYIKETAPQQIPGQTPPPGQNGNGVTNTAAATGPLTQDLSAASPMQGLLAGTGGVANAA